MRKKIIQCRWIFMLCVGAVCIYCFPRLIFSQPPQNVDGMFKSWDKNNDGVLIREEVPFGPRQQFDRIDRNRDGRITLEEHLAPRPPHVDMRERPKLPESVTRHVIQQTWPQEPDGFDREYFVRLPAHGNRFPIVILLHGNGGMAKSMIGNWSNQFPQHCIVSPQGYAKSWNISNERSKAPDVAFVISVLNDMAHRYPSANQNDISLIGFSNGAGLVYRLLIEGGDIRGIQNAIAFVSSMTSGQYRERSFWKRSNESGDMYDTAVIPVGQKSILTIHGTADTVVPYYGGRGPGGTHLSAQDTAYAWALAQGFEGSRIPDNEGVSCGQGLVRYEYASARVSHIKIVGGRHGLGQERNTIETIIRQMLDAKE